MKKKTLIFLSCLVFGFLVSCNQIGPSKIYRVGVDPTWYPYNFQAEQSNIQGFVDELLLEISHRTNVEFNRMETNWDNLFEGLEKQDKKPPQYDCVIAIKEPHNFNLEKYHFSDIFLETGPVVVVYKDSTYKTLQDLSKKRIGIVQGNLIVRVLQKYSDILILSYDGIPKLLNELDERKIEGAVVPQIIAVSYLKNIYPDRFRMTAPIFDEGLRFISLRQEEKSEKLMELLDKTIKEMQKDHSLETLQKKWNLL